MALTLTERQADIWRTAAAVIYNAARRQCADLRTLMIREGDNLYHGMVAACVAHAFVESARRSGATEHPFIAKAEQAFAWCDEQIEADPDEAVKMAHQSAHALTAVVLAHNDGDRSIAIAKAHALVERFATGDYGPGIGVE